MLRFVWSSDWHLGVFHGKMPNATQHQFDTLYPLLDYAESHDIHWLIVTADVSDKSHLPEDCRIALDNYLLAATEKGINVVLLAGNHDCLVDKVTALDSLKNIADLYSYQDGDVEAHVYVVTEPMFKVINGVPCHFLPYPHTEPIQDKDGICFAHVEATGATLDNGVSAKRGAFLSPHHFYFLGHLHLSQQGANYEYIGSPYQVRMGENEKKVFADVTVDAKLSRKIRRIPTDSAIQMHQLFIEHEADFDALSTDCRVLYSIEVAPNVVVPRDKLRKMGNIIKLKTNTSRMAKPKQSQWVELDETTLLKNFLANLPAETQARALALDAQFRSQIALDAAKVASTSALVSDNID